MNIVRRIIKGINVNESTLAVDAIHRVGPRGHFLMDDHTLKYLHSGELMKNELFGYAKREVWIADGAKSTVQKAGEKAQDTLSKHIIEPLPESLTRELKTIVKSAEKNLVN